MAVITATTCSMDPTGLCATMVGNTTRVECDGIAWPQQLTADAIEMIAAVAAVELGGVHSNVNERRYHEPPARAGSPQRDPSTRRSDGQEEAHDAPCVRCAQTSAATKPARVWVGSRSSRSTRSNLSGAAADARKVAAERR